MLCHALPAVLCCNGPVSTVYYRSTSLQWYPLAHRVAPGQYVGEKVTSCHYFHHFPAPEQGALGVTPGCFLPLSSSSSLTVSDSETVNCGQVWLQGHLKTQS